MKKRNLLALALVVLLSGTLVLTGCGKTEEKTPDNGKNPSEVVDQKEGDQNKNNEEDDDMKELMTEETYKMHMKMFRGDELEMELVIQKDGKNMASEFLVMPKEMEAMGMKIKKQLILDGKGAFMNVEINGKDLWAKMGTEELSNDLANGINPKKLLKKLKEENTPKTEKEVRGETYDCYVQDESEICFDGKTLKYVLYGNETISEIVEYDDDVDSDAFEEPSETISQQEMQKMMMEAFQVAGEEE